MSIYLPPHEISDYVEIKNFKDKNGEWRGEWVLQKDAPKEAKPIFDEWIRFLESERKKYPLSDI